MIEYADNPWTWSTRADPRALPLADRHYNRQKIGSPQYVPPGACVCLVTANNDAVWVTSWPIAAYVKHAWAGAWVNSLFRNESQILSSTLIIQAIEMTLRKWPQPPPLGIVSFIDATKTRKKRDPGRCYRRAGWSHVGFTQKDHLYTMQLTTAEMALGQWP